MSDSEEDSDYASCDTDWGSFEFHDDDPPPDHSSGFFSEGEGPTTPPVEIEVVPDGSSRSSTPTQPDDDDDDDQQQHAPPDVEITLVSSASSSSSGHQGNDPSQLPNNALIAPRIPRPTRAKKAGLVLSVIKVERLLLRGIRRRVNRNKVAIMLTSVVEHLMRIIMIKVVDEAQNKRQMRLRPRHLMLAIRGDDKLSKFLSDVIVPESGTWPYVHPFLLP